MRSKYHSHAFRFFVNLIDFCSRSLVSKNVEMQDQMRLGGAQKLWTFKRADTFLPQIAGNQGL